MNDDSLIHRGHRQRMKNKLMTHGAKIFDSYELLEMLLYRVIPYKDTNPLAKRLLSKFGSLSGVLSASEEELLSVPGIGKRAAELLVLAGSFGSYLDDGTASNVPVFDDIKVAGEFFVDYFSCNSEKNAVLCLLDNGMRLIDTVAVECTNFGSAAVKPGFFVDAVTRSGAGNALVACNHRYSALFFTDSEIATYKSIKSALSDIRVPLVAGFVVSGRKYANYNPGGDCFLLAHSPAYESFIESLGEEVFTVE